MTTFNQISHKSDSELLNLLRANASPEVFALLAARYVVLIYGICLKYMKNAQRAQDAVIHIFDIVFSNIADPKADNFREWIYATAKNFCINLLQPDATQKKSRGAEVDLSDILSVLCQNSSKKNDILLINAIEQLPDRQKNTVTSFFFEKKSYQDIADQTGLLLADVKDHLKNSLLNLKDILKKYQK